MTIRDREFARGEPGGPSPARLPIRELGTDTDDAIRQALAYLFAQSKQDFAECRHEMTFPRRAGFRVRREHQVGDIFARAVLGSVLLDVARLADTDTRDVWIEIVRREADYVAGARLTDRDGGWSYFPDLPELPPDLDSLSAAMTLFARAAPHYLALCDGPVELALAEQGGDGRISTWILAPSNTSAQNELMRKGIKKYWGDGIDVEVCARFFRALRLTDATRFAEPIRRGAEFIVSRQLLSGLWAATWYWGEVYGTGLCLDLLRGYPSLEAAVNRAAEAVRRSQRDDGGWGVWESVPLDSAVALWEILREDVPRDTDRVYNALRLLLDHQASDGSWPATPWIRMDVGRARGRATHTLTYQSRTITTALVVRSLMLATTHGRDT